MFGIVITPQIWGLISVVLACVSLAPYLWMTIKGTNKPHLFTWIIWTLLSGIAFTIQVLEGAGAGAWSGGASTFLSVLILLAAIRHGEKQITRSDWVVFLAALGAIPIWLATQNPLYAAIWVTGIDALGYIPTFRKSWNKPHEEMTWTHTVAGIKHLCVLMAVQNVSITTTVYSFGMLAMNAVLVASILYRRWGLRRSQNRNKSNFIH